MNDKSVYIEWDKENKFDHSYEEEKLIKVLKTIFPLIYSSIVWLKSRSREFGHGVIIHLNSEDLDELDDAYWIEIFVWDKIYIGLETIGEPTIGQVHFWGLDTIKLEDMNEMKDSILKIFKDQKYGGKEE